MTFLCRIKTLVCKVFELIGYGGNILPAGQISVK